MTINEVADLLDFPKEHIRLYIKLDLIPGIKRNTKNPDISGKELTYIKRAIILRRLRWRFVDIASYMHGRTALHKTAENIAKLMEDDYEFKIRPDFLILTKQIADESNAHLDADRYWDLISKSNELKNETYEPELNFLTFISTDFPQGYVQSKSSPRSLKNTAIYGLIICLIFGVISFIKNRSLIDLLNCFSEIAITVFAFVLCMFLLFLSRRVFGAKNCHGFVAVLVTILCIIIAIGAASLLLILITLF